MSYAVFSKRTKIINRIVDDLTSLLPSESMIEVDPEILYSRGRKIPVEGQKVNTMGFPLFLQGSSPTINPQTIAYSGDDRAYISGNSPIFERPENPAGDPLTEWRDVPIISYPFSWTAYEVADNKYEAVLAKNYPFQVIVGEEFIDDTHIDTAASDKIVLSEGRCFVAPGGELVTDEFQFFVTSRGVINPLGTDDDDARQFVFDTYYVDFEPAPPQGVKIYWRTRLWDTGALTKWTATMLNEQRDLIPFEEVAPATSQGIQLRVINQTGSILEIENYILLLRIKVLPYTPA